MSSIHSPDTRGLAGSETPQSDAGGGTSLVLGLGIGFVLGLALGLRFPMPTGSATQKVFAQLSLIRFAMEQYYSDWEAYPPASQGLSPLSTVGINGPYLGPTDLVDPWGRPFTYRVSNWPDVASLGADGAVGGVNDNTDHEIRLKQPVVSTSSPQPAATLTGREEK